MPSTGAPTPSGLIGMFVGIGAKNGIASRDSRSGALFESRICREYGDSTLTPDAFVPLPSMTVFAPMMSSMKGCAGDAIRGFRLRLIAAA